MKRRIRPSGRVFHQTAKIKLGDYFAYAMAKNAQASLLFKDEDFDKTDILPAVR